MSVKYLDLPVEIRIAMLNEQRKQGNVANAAIFSTQSIYSDKNQGGFNWNETIEGSQFWSRILTRGEISIYFDEYPKITTPWAPKHGEIVNVSNNRIVWLERIFLITIENTLIPHLCVTVDSQRDFKQGKPVNFAAWKYVEKFKNPQQIVELTIADISAGKGAGVDPNLIRIKK